MDFRQFFDGLFKLNEELGSFFEESLFSNQDIYFGNVNENPKNLSPRDMMLKKPESPSSFGAPIDRGDNLFRSKSFVKTFNSDPNGRFEEKIVIRDGDGNEKIITKHSTGGRTTHKEVHRKGNQIISEKEVVSDIGDDLGRLGHDDDGNKNGDDKKDNNFWKWF